MKTAARLLVLTSWSERSTPARGTFEAPIDDRQGIIHYELAGPSGPGHARLRRG